MELPDRFLEYIFFICNQCSKICIHFIICFQQTQVIAAAAAGVASERLSPQEAKIEAENVAQLSVALAENAVVILMLVEDHLRLQGQHYISSHLIDDSKFSSLASTTVNHSSALGKSAGELSNNSFSRKNSTLSDSSGLPLDVSHLYLF